MKQGNTVTSFGSTLVEDEIAAGTLDELKEHDIKWTANSMYAASIDTTLTVITQFILALMTHPEVLSKAQKEIDTVMGTNRLPTFNDRPNLPYIDAIMSETFRWGVPIPLNPPHMLMEDDIYKGMFIPRGSLIFGNIWSMLRNEKIYPNPDAFYPERFLSKSQEGLEKGLNRDPRDYVFGFGRRRCPGANLVESSIWLLMACIIATTDITKATDERGNVVEPEVVYDNAIFRIPNSFPCNIKPRSEQALKMVQASMPS